MNPVPKKKSDPLQKRIPKNPKYEHIKSDLDTGWSMTKFLEKYSSSMANTRFRKTEPYRRVKARTLAKMIMWGDGQEELENLNNDEDSPRPVTEREYLLLDVRLEDEFEVNSITGAVHYPAAMLSRSTNQYIPELYHFKNHESKIIVCYSDEERVASQTAINLYEKGFDNVFILSGGIRKFYQDYGELVVGEAPPPPIVATPPKTSRRGGSGMSSRGSTVAGSVTRRSTRPPATSRSIATARSSYAGSVAGTWRP